MRILIRGSRCYGGPAGGEAATCWATRSIFASRARAGRASTGPGRILTLFRITGLVNAFAVYSSVPEAITAAGAAASAG